MDLKSQRRINWSNCRYVKISDKLYEELSNNAIQALQYIFYDSEEIGLSQYENDIKPIEAQNNYRDNFELIAACQETYSIKFYIVNLSTPNEIKTIEIFSVNEIPDRNILP